MKKYCTLLILFCCTLVMAQNPDKIIFAYDDAGNQTIRELCINCTNPNARYISNPKDLKKEDLVPSEVSNLISYYPNPVREELYLSWELANNNAVASIQIYDLNGRLLRTFQGLTAVTIQTIPFIAYPAGNYLVMLVYSNGEQKTIKIVKN
jgi:hypothetical protein